MEDVSVFDALRALGIAPPLTVGELISLLYDFDQELEVRIPDGHGYNIPVCDATIREDEDDPEEEYLLLTD